MAGEFLRLRRVHVAPLALAAGALLGMPSSASAAGWLQSVPLNATGSQPKVAGDASGDVVAAWKGPRQIVQASIRPAGGAFTAPVTLTPAGRAAGSFDLDVNDAGAGVLAWTASDGGVPAVQFADVSPGGFGPVQTVPVAAAGADPEDISVAVDGAGTATLAWTFNDSLGTPDPDDDRLRVRLGRRSLGGTVAVTGPLSATTEDAAGPAVAVNAAGLATAAWTVDRLSPSGDLVGASVRSVTWPSGGALGSVETARAVTGDQSSFGDARVAVDGLGATLVAWIESGVTVDRETVQTAVRPAQGGYRAPVNLSGAAENASGLALDVNEAGTAVLAYSVSAVSGGAGTLRVAGRSPGGQLSGPGQAVAIGPASEELGEPAATVNGAGTAFVAWSRESKVSPTSAVEAAVGPPGALGAATRLSLAGTRSKTPAISADGEGNAFAAWDAAGPLGATAFDGAPPQLRGLAVPATAAVEEVAGFSVAPFDTWSAVTTTWDFGDATSALGDAVSHAYGSAGSYAVGVTATDAAGNASSDSRTVAVTPKATALTPPRLGLSLTNVAGSRYCLAASRPTNDLVLGFRLNDPATMTFRLQRRSAPRAKPRSRCPRRGGAPGVNVVQFDDVQTATLPALAGESFVDVKRLRGQGGKASAANSRRTAKRTMRLGAGRARARLAQLFGSGPLRPGWYRVLLQGRREDDGSISQAVSVKFLVLDERR